MMSAVITPSPVTGVAPEFVPVATPVTGEGVMTALIIRVVLQDKVF